MALEYLNLNGLSRFYEKIKAKIDAKLDKPTGGAGQVVGFTANNVVGAMNIPYPDCVIEQNASVEQKLWVGVKAEFDALAVKSEDTLYIITDDDSGEVVASKAYVDGLVGDINSILDAVNGEV